MTDGDSKVLWTLITVTFNSAATLRAHWQGFTAKSGVEWIVVDNDSSDDSAETALSLGATQVVRLDKNIGFGAANNEAYRRARGSYVAFVNPDITLDQDSLGELRELVDTQKALIGPQLTYRDGSLQPSGRNTPSLTNKILGRLGVKRVQSRYFIIANAGECRYVSWLVGAAVVGNKAQFDQLGPRGPWDEAFFVYYEDADLGLRGWSQGIPSIVAGDVKWVHGWARATQKVNLKPWRLEFRSMRVFYGRYPELIFGWRGGRRFRKIWREKWGSRTCESSQLKGAVL